ncbi:EAL domain-containing protein [Mangrovibrevibacter kandeliae]|uniref:EAL domain-containing protein n=1 Tax=Mangrovibrevibacter kandeliae TaxID=2968473 RepID=UPI002117C1A5|nr:cyclic diguanylate phosphodiesterase [Aurantimonas sp. CSK15Z-1]
MSRLAKIFIADRHRPATRYGMGLLVFALIFCATLWMQIHAVDLAAQTYLDSRLAGSSSIAKTLQSVFAKLKSDVTALPCSDEFKRQLHEIAYLPDGLSEFIYAPDRVPLCSTGGLAVQQVQLGTPDFELPDASIWLDRDLSFIGLAGRSATLVYEHPFVVVVPPAETTVEVPWWLASETVLVDRKGGWAHRSGTIGLFHHLKHPAQSATSVLAGTLTRMRCAAEGFVCVIAEADLFALAGRWSPVVLASFVLSLAIAASAAMRLDRTAVSYWSFERRLLRRLSQDTIACRYQPVMELTSGQIEGCEVLARWRDVDGSIVPPAAFLPVIERFELTRDLTRFVAVRAYDELSEIVPAGDRLSVAFNIFPRDLDSTFLAEVFRDFLVDPRFDIVIEIIEHEALLANAQSEIEALGRLGFRTFIDDFGTGYSTINLLGDLAVDGVKLDRAFAMAPEGSLKSLLLEHAVRMIHASGREVVVEGVETAECMARLRLLDEEIASVQGFFIAPPLEAADFRHILLRRRRPEAALCAA